MCSWSPLHTLLLPSNAEPMQTRSAVASASMSITYSNTNKIFKHKQNVSVQHKLTIFKQCLANPQPQWSAVSSVVPTHEISEFKISAWALVLQESWVRKQGQCPGTLLSASVADKRSQDSTPKVVSFPDIFFFHMVVICASGCFNFVPRGQGDNLFASVSLLLELRTILEIQLIACKQDSLKMLCVYIQSQLLLKDDWEDSSGTDCRDRKQVRSAQSHYLPCRPAECTVRCKTWMTTKTLDSRAWAPTFPAFPCRDCH